MTNNINPTVSISSITVEQINAKTANVEKSSIWKGYYISKILPNRQGWNNPSSLSKIAVVAKNALKIILLISLMIPALALTMDWICFKIDEFEIQELKIKEEKLKSKIKEELSQANTMQSQQKLIKLLIKLRTIKDFFQTNPKLSDIEDKIKSRFPEPKKPPTPQFHSNEISSIEIKIIYRINPITAKTEIEKVLIIEKIEKTF